MSNARATLRIAIMDGSIVPTAMRLPPQFVTDVGYRRRARYVSLFWLGERETALLDDGDVASDGHWEIYRAWANHAYVLWSTLSGWNFGSDTARHTHRWLIDQTTHMIFAGKERVVAQLVQGQWADALPPRPEDRPGHDPTHHGAAERLDFLRLGLMETLETRSRRVRLLTAWLDEQWAGMMLRHPDREPILRYLIGPRLVFASDDSAATGCCN